MKASCCKDCTSRQVGCHSNCKEYLIYRKAQDDRNTLIKENRRQSSDVVEFKKEMCRKQRRMDGR